MNKTKKIAFAVISTVMAGTMLFSASACTPTDGPGKTDNPNVSDNPAVNKLVKHMVESQSQTRESTMATGWNTAKNYWDYLGKNVSGSAIKDEYGVLNTDGTLKYSVYENRGKVTLNIAIGHNNATTGTNFQNDLGDEITLPDGKTYYANDLKPAWVQMGKDLNITFNNQYKGWSTSANLDNFVKGEQQTNYADVDMFTTDLSKAVDNAASGTSILNLAQYLDNMPNFKKFLTENPIVYLSLLQDGMNTTTGDGQVLYVAPYFDGNDDIERYCIIRQDWVKKLLNGTADLTETGTTFKASCKQVSASSYMQQTGKLEIESTNYNGSGKVTIVKDYDAALAAAKSEAQPLGAAYKAIANAAYNGTSGNIVDIMNAALTANENATGAQLVALYRAYIDVCYKEKGQSGAYYTATERANLFNGYDACWDVDDLVAMLRCIKTNGKTLTGSDTKTIEGIVPRTGDNQRTPDIVRLCAQLYGVRGAASTYEYTYIDNKGELQDARNDAEFYDALARMHTLTEEGLVADYSGISAFEFAQAVKGTEGEAFMMYDYSQTQTLNGFYAEDSNLSGVTLPNGYYMSPVITPVSKWDVDGDGNHTDVMRFTESWRSTKTSGLAVNGAVANNPDKLKAVLQFVDYLYSEDGQIVSTYGPMATSASGAGGFWYNNQATQAQITAGKYFTYKGVKYAGTEYKGKITPTITDNLYNSFKGLEVNGWKLSQNSKVSKAALSFTNYARYIIGSTLPIGVKDQSFENQLTSQMGQAGANKVGVALANGTIKGMSLAMDSNNWWYTCVPTGLPIQSDLVKNILGATNMDHLKYITGTDRVSGQRTHYSIFNYIILFGLTGTYNQQSETYTF